MLTIWTDSEGKTRLDLSGLLAAHERWLTAWTAKRVAWAVAMTLLTLANVVAAIGVIRYGVSVRREVLDVRTQLTEALARSECWRRMALYDGRPRSLGWTLTMEQDVPRCVARRLKGPP